jgi:hypothetical protein
MTYAVRPRCQTPAASDHRRLDDLQPNHPSETGCSFSTDEVPPWLSVIQFE